jgi:hypothetical protein
MNSYFNLVAANAAAALAFLLAASGALAAAESSGPANRSDDDIELSFASQLLFCSHFIPMN